MTIAAHQLSLVYHVKYITPCGVCLQIYMDLLSWLIEPYMTWYKVLVVFLCQLRYLQVQDILFLIFQGVQVPRYHSLTQLDICPLWYIKGP